MSDPFSIARGDQIGRLKLFFVAPIMQHYAKATETGDRATSALHGRALYRIRAQPHRSASRPAATHMDADAHSAE